MSNNKSADSRERLYSSPRGQMFYEVLEEHVALKSELGRLTRIYESTLKVDS